MLKILKLHLVALCLLTTLPLDAQLPGETPISQRALDRIYRGDEAENAPDLRTLFYQNEETELCLAVGIKRGPGEILPGFLGFVRRLEVGEKTKKERLKFKFPKKSRQEKGGLLVWTDCVAVENPDRIPQSAVEITVRRMRQPTETFVTPLPPPGDTWGLDIWRHPGGELTSTEYREGGA